jgi:hypothetical protein
MEPHEQYHKKVVEHFVEEDGNESFSSRDLQQLQSTLMQSLGEEAPPDKLSVREPREMRRATAAEMELFAHEQGIPLLELSDDPEFAFVVAVEEMRKQHLPVLVCVDGPVDHAYEQQSRLVNSLHEITAEGKYEEG